MNKLTFLKRKFVIFVIQISILSLFIYVFTYRFEIDFDKEISKERKDIIQFIANYIQFEGLSNLLFIYLTWIIISLIPILIYNDYKKAYSMNLTTFFFPNFFFYVFLSRYSPDYYNSYFQLLIMQTIVLGIVIALISIGISLLLKKISGSLGEIQLEDLERLVQKNILKCHYCGTSFNSIPKYCYNCSKELDTAVNLEE